MSDTISIHRIFLSRGHDFKGRFVLGRLNHEVIDVDSVECVKGRGLVGDRYFDFKDNYKGQVSLIALEDIEAMASDLDLAFEDHSKLRRNLVVSGVDLNALVGKEFRIGEVRLQGSEKCKPCFWMDQAIAPGAHAALEDRGGHRYRCIQINGHAFQPTFYQSPGICRLGSPRGEGLLGRTCRFHTLQQMHVALPKRFQSRAHLDNCFSIAGMMTPSSSDLTLSQPSCIGPASESDNLTGLRASTASTT